VNETEPNLNLRGSGLRRLGLPIGLWLVLGFAVVIGAVVITSTVAMRSTRLATTDVARVQNEIEPLTRAARRLGDRAAAFDRAVLAFLRVSSAENREGVTQAGVDLSTSIAEVVEAESNAPGTNAQLAFNGLAAHHAAGFELLRQHDRRNAALGSLAATFDSIDRRITGAGGGGLRIGDSLVSRPSLAELARALETMRNEATIELSRSGAGRSSRDSIGEKQFQSLLKKYHKELRQSPGVAWLDLVTEDFRKARDGRQRIRDLDAALESSRAEFSAGGDTLARQIQLEVEAPAWLELMAAAEAARIAAENSERTIADATVKAVLLTLFALIITAWAITWPVRRLTARTRQLAAGDLTARVPRGGANEIDELAKAFNHLAAQLDAAEKSVKTYQAQLERRVEERTTQLRHLAEHDPLTNLPNRRQLFAKLDELIESADPAHARLAVLFLDLDNFKTVNDSLGHEFGDRVLTEIGERLRQISGETGFIARIGGDEFTLVFPFSGATDEIEAKTSKLVGSFRQPLTIDQREIAIGVSCGAAVFPDHGRNATALLRAADTALFHAKELGRNRLCVYHPGLLVAASNRFRAEQALRRAIDGGEFMLHYQPQVCLNGKTTTSVEALLRWRQSDELTVPAGEFIAVAEQSGLMLSINEWVLERAARDVSEWRKNGWPEARVAINVSAQQFVAGDFPAEIERLLNRYDLPADALELELTESMLQTGAITVETLRGLRMLGVSTALDDFGTGYSSLTSLEQLPLSRVKLDRSVVAEVDWNPRAASIARSIIGLCRTLGLQVTVEGVERPNQLDFLVGCGEVSVQGFLVARPQEASEIINLVNGSGDRMNALLQAAELSREDSVGEIGDATIRMLRQRRT
jgi:diguanylate cyclase (GGDEF)-like protein